MPNLTTQAKDLQAEILETKSIKDLEFAKEYYKNLIEIRVKTGEQDVDAFIDRYMDQILAWLCGDRAQDLYIKGVGEYNEVAIGDISIKIDSQLRVNVAREGNPIEENEDYRPQLEKYISQPFLIKVRGVNVLMCEGKPYVLGEMLGIGGNGTVYLAVSVDNPDDMLVIKMQCGSMADINGHTSFIQTEKGGVAAEHELAKIYDPDNKGVVGVSIDTKSNSAPDDLIWDLAFASPDNLPEELREKRAASLEAAKQRRADVHFLVQRYFPGERLGKLEQQPRISENSVSVDKIDKMIGQLRNTAERLQEFARKTKGFYMMDVRPENILCDKNTGEIKLIDYGAGGNYKLYGQIGYTIEPIGTDGSAVCLMHPEIIKGLLETCLDNFNGMRGNEDCKVTSLSMDIVGNRFIIKGEGLEEFFTDNKVTFEMDDSDQTFAISVADMKTLFDSLEVSVRKTKLPTGKYEDYHEAFSLREMYRFLGLPEMIRRLPAEKQLQYANVLAMFDAPADARLTLDYVLGNLVPTANVEESLVGASQQRIASAQAAAKEAANKVASSPKVCEIPQPKGKSPNSSQTVQSVKEKIAEWQKNNPSKRPPF